VRRYLKKMHLAAVSCLVLAGCGGGGGGTATAVLNLMVETLTGGTFSADALSVSRFQSITTDWRQAAQDLRNTALYQTQQFSWYVDSNNNAARDPATEPLFNSFSIASSRVDYAHAAGLTGAGQTIAVMDDGFLTSHETIAGRVTAGYTGPVENHGTAVASILAGLSSEMIGVAPGATLVLGTYDSPENRAAATNLARARGAIVQNNSWGFVGEPANSATFSRLFANGSEAPYLAALQNYTRNGVVVFAAGNNPFETTAGIMEALPLFAPELEPGWLTVISGVPSFDDNRILSVQRVSAPCLQAARWCLVADGSWMAASADSVSSYGTAPVIGTSFAAPVVSGAIALLAEAFPTLTAHDLRARLIATADNDFAGFTASGRLEVIPGSGVFHDYSTEWGHGFLDVRAALLPIGTPVARMADGTAQVADQPMILAGGATGDAVARSLSAVPVLVTDALGGDFTMPGSALAATPSTPPVSTRLWQSMFSPDQRPGVIQAYGGADMAFAAGGLEMAFIAPDSSRALNGDPAMAATIGQRIAAAGGEVFIGLNVTRDDGTLLPGIGGQASTLAALELAFTHQGSNGAFVEMGGSFGMAPGGSGVALSRQSDVRFNAFRLEAGQRDILRTGDKLRFGVSLPIAVTSGRTEIALPVARSASGIDYRQVGIDYSPRDREINLSVTYDAPIGRGTDLFVGAIHAVNHGHIAGQRDTAAILGIRKTF
jgi:subtilase-type serine protease